jgi:hypothetical protein
LKQTAPAIAADNVDVKVNDNVDDHVDAAIA